MQEHTSAETEVTTRPVIIGAGPGGVASAITLAQAGIPCILTDKADFPRDKICGDALSGKVVEIVNKFDRTWIPEFYHHAPQIPSWGVTFIAPSGEQLQVPFKKEYNVNGDLSPGFICKRYDFDDWWLKKALTFSEIDFRTQKEVKQIEREKDKILLTFQDGTRLIAPVIIGADGAHSLTAKRLHQFKVSLSDYCAGIRCYYQNVEGLHPHGFIELHFIKKLLPGYFWIFPLPNGCANVGLGIRSDVVSRKKLNLKDLFKEIIASEPAIASRFENATPLENIKGYGLPLGTKKRCISGDQYLLVGDAGSLIDPFTGEGIGNALVSGRLAGMRVAECWASQDFSAQQLSAYDQAVYARLWDELQLSRLLQKLIRYPFLFNFVLRKANRNPTLRETISCMFEDVDLRKRFQNPLFYWKILFDNV